MINNAYQVRGLTPVQERKIGRQMEDLAKRERNVPGMPIILDPGVGAGKGRPPHRYRDSAIASLRVGGPMLARELAKVMGIPQAQAADALSAARRIGKVECEGHLWSAIDDGK
jgi:hypothetical protein